MNPRILAVILKEFREYRRNRLILLTMAILPLIFLTLPIIGVVTLPERARPDVVEAVVGQALLFFLLIPVILPTTIAAYTVIGEREQSTLEPLLSTPVTDEEVLVGKAAAATIPAVLLAWLLFGVFLTVTVLFSTDAARDEVLTPAQVVAQLAVSPVLAIFAIEVGMAISVRSSDIRVAQQLAGLAMLPMFGVIALFSFGVLEPTVSRYLLGAAVILAIDVVGWRLVLAMFDRDRLLTRYGA